MARVQGYTHTNNTTSALNFGSTATGTNVRNLDLKHNEAVFNENGSDIDFRVESNSNTHMLFVDAGSDEIGVRESSPTSTLDIAGRLGARQIQFRGGIGASDRINRMSGWGHGNTSSSGATWRLVGTIDLPDSSYSSISLMVKTTYPGSNYGAYNASAHVWHNQANITRKTTSVVDAANIYGPYNDKIRLHRNAAGQWELQARSVSDNQALAIEVTTLSSAGGAGFETQEGIVAGSTGGTTATPSGDMQYFSQLSSFQQYGSAVFNENGNDNDFRVESNNKSHMLFVDASADKVGINQAYPAAALDIVTTDTAGADALRLRQPSSSETYQLQLGVSAQTNNGLYLRNTGSTGQLQSWTAGEVCY